MYTFLYIFQCLQEISVNGHKKIVLKEKKYLSTTTCICIHIVRAWSRVKAQVEAETDERAGLHQEDGHQRSS